MRFWLQLILIPALALIGAAASMLWVERPERQELTTDEWARTAAEVAALGDILWVDARPTDAFAQGHIDGAVHVSLNDWDRGFEDLIMAWTPDLVVVVYCDREGCELSRETAERLRRELGDDRVYWLEGGYETWLEQQS